MAIECTITGNFQAWADAQNDVMQEVRDVMCRSILNQAQMLAPVLTGALRADGRVEEVDEHTTQVIFGDEKVPYARLRHYENKKNPQTLLYLQRAGESVAKRGIEGYKKQ